MGIVMGIVFRHKKKHLRESPKYLNLLGRGDWIWTNDLRVMLQTNTWSRPLILAGMYRWRPDLRAGSSDTNHEIKLNHREALHYVQDSFTYRKILLKW